MAMIDDATAARFVKCGWIAAAFAGALTAICAFLRIYGLNGFNFVDAALLLGMAYGIYRGSRVCAIIALIYDLLSQAFLLTHGRSLNFIGLFSTIAFVVLYTLGVVGTFAMHSRRRSPAANNADTQPPA
jgi:serine/threonine-protein kinase